MEKNKGVWQGNKAKHLSKNPAVSSLDNKLKRDIIKILNKVKKGNILDVGCGEGFITSNIARAFPETKITAIDPEEQYIKYAKKFNSLPNIKFETGDLDSFNSKDRFDLVISTEVLEHLDKPFETLKKMISFSGKYVLFTVPNEPFFRIGNFLSLKYVRRFGNTPGHLNNWTKKKLAGFVSKTGLRFKIKTSSFWNIVLIEVD